MPGSGVQRRRLSLMLKDSTHASVYRHKTISADNAAWVCHYASEQTGKNFDHLSAARAGVISGCEINSRIPAGRLIVTTDDIIKGDAQGHDASFFCSELIIRAFELADISVIPHMPAHSISPGYMIKSPYLDYIGDLKSA